MSNRSYNQLLSEYGRDFHDAIVQVIEDEDRVQCLAFAFQFCEWITSVLTNGQPSKPTIGQRLLNLGGAKDYESKEGNVLTPQKLLRVYPGVGPVVGAIHNIRAENVRRRDIRFLSDIIVDLVSVVEGGKDDPVTTVEDAVRFVKAHNYMVRAQNDFHATVDDVDWDQAYEKMERSEFFNVSVTAQYTLAALVYLSRNTDDFTAGQVRQFADVTRSEFDDAIEELEERRFIERESGSRFSNTTIFVERLSDSFLVEFINVPSSDLSDMRWKEAMLYATLSEMIGQQGESVSMMVQSLVDTAFRGRYSSSGGDISSSLRNLDMAGFINLDRTVSPFQFTLTEKHDPEDVFSSLSSDELYEVADVLRREPSGISFSFEREVADRVQAVNELVTQWEQEAITREEQQETGDTVPAQVDYTEMVTVPTDQNDVPATTSSEEDDNGENLVTFHRRDGQQELTTDHVMEMLQQKYQDMSGGEVIEDVLSIVSSANNDSITIDATIEGSTYRRIEIVFNDGEDEDTSRF